VEPAEQVTFGCFHVAVTLVKVSGVADDPDSTACASAIAYPAQFVLTSSAAAAVAAATAATAETTASDASAFPIAELKQALLMMR